MMNITKLKSLSTIFLKVAEVLSIFFPKELKIVIIKVLCQSFNYKENLDSLKYKIIYIVSKRINPDKPKKDYYPSRILFSTNFRLFFIVLSALVVFIALVYDFHAILQRFFIEKLHITDVSNNTYFLIYSTPIALVLWYFRDLNNNRDVAEKNIKNTFDVFEKISTKILSKNTSEDQRQILLLSLSTTFNNNYSSQHHDYMLETLREICNQEEAKWLAWMQEYESWAKSINKGNAPEKPKRTRLVEIAHNIMLKNQHIFNNKNFSLYKFNLSGFEFDSVSMKGVDFSKATLIGASFRNCTLIECSLFMSNLFQSKIISSFMIECRIKKSNMSFINIIDSTIVNSIFHESNLSCGLINQSEIINTNINCCGFLKSKLINVFIKSSDLSDSFFEECEFELVEIINTKTTRLYKADKGIIFHGSKKIDLLIALNDNMNDIPACIKSIMQEYKKL